MVPKINYRKVNFNESIFGASNLIFKPNDKFKIKNNLFFTKDKNSLYYDEYLTYLLDSVDIIVNSNQDLIRKPLIGECRLGIDYQINKKSIIDYDLLFTDGQVESVSKRNTSTGFFNENLSNKNFLIKQKLNYTNRISDKNAVIVDFNYLYNKKPQKYSLNPFYKSDIFNTYLNDSVSYNSIQNSTLKLNDFALNVEYIGISNIGNYSILAGYNYSDEALNTSLIVYNDANEVDIGNDFVNNSLDNSQHLFIEFMNKHEKKYFKTFYGLSLNKKTISYQSSNINDNQAIYLASKVGLGYKKDFNAASIVYSYDKKYLSLNDIYVNYILTDYRTLTSGSINNELISSHILLGNYVFSNFYRQFLIYTNLLCIINDKAIGSQIFVDNTNTLVDKHLISGNENYIISAGVNKYIPLIYSTIKLKTDFSWYKYSNMINDFELRKNLSFSSNYKLSLKTAFNSFFNLEAKTDFIYTKFETNASSEIIDNSDVDVKMNLIFRVKDKLIMNIINETLFYNLDNCQEYYFLDFDIKYVLKKNKLSLKLIGRNLLNNTNLSRNNISDYYLRVESFGLLPRHIILVLKYRL